ncbi:MAG: dephospho-CoA kinase [Gammaproteobacteria bacterium]|nr:dephospho-CoA kinase [Gammaproteobacteria bacterium]
MLRIALTGGICSGKTTVSRMFEALGIPVIDADVIARELVTPGSPALRQIISAFGPGLITQDGQLDRERLRQRVFADPAQRRQLEAILHPLIRSEMRRRVAQLTTPYCILSIPLLVETGQQDLADRILVIDTPETLQRQRLQARDRRSTAEIDAVLAAQSPRALRLAAADDVIINADDLPTLERQVARLHQDYLRLAATSH